MSDSVRLDKWLWAARFFKTRGLAQQAIKGGKVDINDHRAKPSRLLRIGDRLSITRGEQLYEIDVLGLTERRLSAPLAQALYAETEAGRKARELLTEQRRLERDSQAGPQRRPDKRQRRQISKLLRGD